MLGRRLRPLSVFVASCVMVGTAAAPLVAVPHREPPVASEPLCVEPHPCDYVWEGDDLGPFELADVEEIEVESHDGVMLHGWLAYPDFPDGIRAPVALHSSPYLGVCITYDTCVPTPGEPDFWADDPDAAVIRTWGVPPIELVRHGYIAAFFEVRGTGESGGCYEWEGTASTQDQGVLVDWLADQEWSNGRVGMGGNSAPAIAAWQAAIGAPDALKTIVTTGIISDAYTAWHSPQGMWYEVFPVFDASAELPITWLPHAGSGSDSARDLGAIADRVADGCQPFSYQTEVTKGGLGDSRDPDFWEPRRYINRFNQVQAAVHMAHGLWDATGHAFQDSLVWEALQRSPPKAPPMWQISGQWGHGPPFADTPALTPEWVRDNWHSILFDWLAYWLQGVGDTPPHRVDYQDTTGQWHTSSAWPPVGARDEALYLDGDRLATAPGEDDRRFRAAPSPTNDHGSYWSTGNAGPPVQWSWCRQELQPDDGFDTGVAWVSDPFEEHSLLAGNPFAYLELSSDEPGGLVEVSLVRWPEGASCADPPAVPDVVSRGGADLRYHEGGYDAKPFPVDTLTQVRVDLYNNVVRFAPGDRLVVSISGPEKIADNGSTSPFIPEVTVRAGLSHVVVPFVSGSLGGQPAGIDYPPNPAAPWVASQ